MTAMSAEVGGATASTGAEKLQAGWDTQLEDKASNGWRTESVDTQQKTQSLSPEQLNTVMKDLVTKFGVEMVKQQNPTDSSKFKIGDDE